MVVNIVRDLTALGYSEYEARVYVALLRASPAGAYETAKRSGVPTSKVYEVLARLRDKGLVMELEEGARTRYTPMAPEELVDELRDTTGSAIDSLARGLASLEVSVEVSYVWNLTDYEDLMRRAAHLANAARGYLLVSMWPQEAARLAPQLAGACARGVRAAVVQFGPGDPGAGQVYRHPIEDTIYAEKGGRGFVMVVDSAECLMATVTDGGVHGARSRNPGFVMLAEDYIKHDVYIMKIVSRFDEELTQTFGERYRKLRDIYTDEEENG